MNRLIAWLLLTAPAVVASAAPPLVTDAELQAWERHDRAALIITHIMDKYHYRKEPLDDTLSSRILDSYLESLDGNRSFFLKQDITDFERYRYLLDEAIEGPDLEPAYAIFKVYRQRVDERSAYARSVLENGFDFSIDEDYGFDRRESELGANRAGIG